MLPDAGADAPHELRHAVEVDVARAAAWRFWTQVEGWALDPAIERVRLDGPFGAGARGETVVRGGSDVVRWEVVEVAEGEGAVIEIPAPGVTARFTWRFEELPGKRTRLTQHVAVRGAGGEVAAVASGLAQGLAAGMARLAAAMERGAR